MVAETTAFWAAARARAWRTSPHRWGHSPALPLAVWSMGRPSTLLSNGMDLGPKRLRDSPHNRFGWERVRLPCRPIERAAPGVRIRRNRSSPEAASDSYPGELGPPDHQ